MHVRDLEADAPKGTLQEQIERAVSVGSERFRLHHRCNDGGAFVVDVSAQYNSFDGGRVVTFRRREDDS